MQRRQAARVLITGSGQLAVPIGSALACAGVGHVHPGVSGITLPGDVAPAGLLPADEYRPRAAAAAEAIRRVAPDVDVTPLRPGQATFAVLVGPTAPATLMAHSYGKRRLAHLAVSVRDGTVVVGPLVRPGNTPCLNCLDMHRRDRDPGWQAVAAELSNDADDAVEATTALAGAAYAAAEVLAHIDGAVTRTVGATVEIATPGQPVRRQWTQHPECGCRRRGPHPTHPTGCFN
jgi:bacteriocin biosynthesis cyclodehydratase domain-containing protein